MISGRGNRKYLLRGCLYDIKTGKLNCDEYISFGSFFAGKGLFC